MYGSEIWLMKVKHKVKLDGSKMSIQTHMWVYFERNKEKCRTQMELLGMEPVSVVIKDKLWQFKLEKITATGSNIYDSVNVQLNCRDIKNHMVWYKSFGIFCQDSQV